MARLTLIQEKLEDLDNLTTTDQEKKETKDAAIAQVDQLIKETKAEIARTGEKSRVAEETREKGRKT